MEAPDKIFIDEDLIAFHVLQTKHDGDIEYIRKDVLMEWAKEHQEGERQGSYTWSCYQIFIDKLNEM